MQEQALHSPPPVSRLASLKRSAATLKTKAPSETRRFIKEYGHWLVLLVPLLALAYGPVAWTSSLWFFPNSPLIFQPYIPILAGLLVWARRRELADLYRRLSRRVVVPEGQQGGDDGYDPYFSRKRAFWQRGRRFSGATTDPLRGSIWLAALGCLLALVTYTTQTPGIAILGLLMILVGAIYYIYGQTILAALTIPLLFLLLMIPPPEALFSFLNPTAQVATASVVGDLLQEIGVTTKMRGHVLLLDGYRLEIFLALSGFNVVIPVMMVTFWWVLYKRAKFNTALVLLAVAMIVSLVIHILRFVLAGVVGSMLGNDDIAKAINIANSFFLIVPTLAIIYFVGRALGVGAARRVAADWYGAYDSEGHFGQSGASAIADARLREESAEVEAARPAQRARAAAKNRHVAAMITLCCLLALFINYRMGKAGEWIPAPPQEVSQGIWQAVDAPIPESTLKGLGDPKAEGRLYNNPFGDPPVNVSIIAGDSFEAYHEPTVCTAAFGFFLKAERELNIDGPNSKIRAMLMRNDTQGETPVRIIMYYWMQHNDGSTDTDRRMGNYRDIAARFKTGLNAAVFGRKTCLVRVFAVVPPADINGEQTHRNIRNISRAIYQRMKADGKRTGSGTQSADSGHVKRS